MKLNTIIKIGDRIGTICYHNLDGTGGGREGIECVGEEFEVVRDERTVL